MSRNNYSPRLMQVPVSNSFEHALNFHLNTLVKWLGNCFPETAEWVLRMTDDGNKEFYFCQEEMTVADQAHVMKKYRHLLAACRYSFTGVIDDTGKQTTTLEITIAESNFHQAAHTIAEFYKEIVDVPHLPAFNNNIGGH